MDKLDPTLMSYLKGPYGAAGLPSITDVSLMQKALPGYGKSINIFIFNIINFLLFRRFVRLRKSWRRCGIWHGIQLF